MTTTNLEHIVLRGLTKGPRWARSFQRAKPVVDRLVAKGLVARVAPAGGKASNMLQLTPAGEAEVHEFAR